jgi:hypothetical protein
MLCSIYPGFLLFYRFGWWEEIRLAKIPAACSLPCGPCAEKVYEIAPELKSNLPPFLRNGVLTYPPLKWRAEAFRLLAAGLPHLPLR